MSPAEPLSAVKLALLAKQVRERLDRDGLSASEPIAIVGVGCRFPGGVDSPEALWDLVRTRGDAIGPVPSDRWITDPDGRTADGAVGIAAGGFIDGIDQFDAAYFGISPREAAHMDPQQRLVLEVAVEALERAGQPVERLAGSHTGVFVASTLHDYGDRYVGHLREIDAHTLTGNAHCIIPNRLSFLYDLRGPSVAVDTACSSSLVAVHLACQSLRARDSDLALAGGVNVMLAPDTGVALAQWGLVAPDGHCKTFDHRADGFVRSEGCGMVVLKRLSDAIADNDPIVAVIRGTAVNQDGRSTAMSAPNGRAQQDVVRQALRDGAVDPALVGCVEAHGTGTIIGDPIEVEALAAVVGAETDGATPLALTAVKANLGHLEAAAGVAGLIKAALCLRHEEVPPAAQFTELNPHISLAGTRLFVPTEAHPWPRSDRPRFAGVSSFGFGGTNAHAVIEEAPELPSVVSDAPSHLFVLSARSPEALRAQAAQVADHLDQSEAPALSAACATASRRRTHHDERLAAVVSSPSDLVEALRAAALGERRPHLAVGHRRPGARPRVAFVFSGQGTQWWGMARDLIADDAVFSAEMARCDAALGAVTGWSILAELAADEGDSRLDRTEVAQPVLFAIQVALAARWREWGVVPTAVVGHSVGEVAAAHVAGALSLEQAAEVIAHRARLMDAATGNGTMASVSLAAEEVAELVARSDGALSIAALNAPHTTVIAGDTDAMDLAVAELRAGGAEVRPLGVDYAFHSRQMAPHAADLGEALEGLVPSASSVPMVSTVTGTEVPGDALDGGYWARNVAEPVRFSAAVTSLLEDGVDVFLEVGPHPVLGGAVLDTVGGRGETAVIAASLRRDRSGREALLLGLGQLHVAGVEIDWTAVHPGRLPMVDLPTYPWQHERHWYEIRGDGPVEPTPASRRVDVEGLLGRRVRSAAIEGAVYELELSPDGPPFLADHRIGDLVVVPGTVHLAMAAAAFADVTSLPATRLADVEILEGLVLGDDEPTVVQVHVVGDASASSFSISSLAPDESWTVHARGTASADPVPEPAAVDPSTWRSGLEDMLEGRDLYTGFSSRGVHFGPAFRLVRHAWVGGDAAVGELAASTIAPSRLPFDPAVLDAAVHPLAALLPGSDETYLPVAIRGLRLHGPLDDARLSRVEVRAVDAQTVSLDVTLADPSGRVVAELTGFRVVRTSVDALARLVAGGGPAEPSPLYALRWSPAPPSGTAANGGSLIIADGSGLADAIIDHLGHHGLPHRCIGADQELTRLVIEEAIGGGDVHDVLFLRGLDTPRLAEGVDPVAAQERSLGGALLVAQALAAAASPARLWLVTAGAQAVESPAVAPEQATLVGLAAAVRAENEAFACVAVDLDPGAEVASQGEALLGLVAAGDDEDIVAWRDGRRWVPRLVALDEPDTEASGASRLVVTTPGMLDGLQQAPAVRRAPEAHEVEIEVRVTGLNFRDVLIALDLYPEDVEVLGEECSGIVTRVGAGVTTLAPGDRVVAVGPGSFASHLTVDADLVIAIPDDLGFDDAATVPIAFLTAHHSLIDLAGLRPGERVLVHAGAGGVGMAAIQVAHRAGAEVLATAGSPAKRALLVELGVEHVFDSRSLDFVEGVAAATGGAGVDVVLNSLSGEFIPNSLDVVAEGGRFVEIGRRDIWDAEQVRAVRPDIGYDIVFLGDIRVGDPAAIQAMLGEIMGQLAAGELRPLPCTPYSLADAVEAFRLMAGARHTGKVVVRHPVADRPPLGPDGTYVVTGGLGGIGLVLARHMVEQGVRHLVLVGRSRPTPSVEQAVDELRGLGAEVVVASADVADREQMLSLLAAISEGMPPVRGLVHAAGVLSDGVLAGQTWERMAATLAPKLGGIHLFDELAHDLPLDLVVLCSAAGVVLDAPGQVGYSAANAFLDSYASSRTGRGSTVAIGWGAWSGVGMTASLDDHDLERMARRGVVPISAEEGTRAFDAAVLAARAHPGAVLAARLAPAALPKRPVLSALRSMSTDRATPAAPDTEVTLFDEWVALPESRRHSAVASFLREEAGKILGLPSSVVVDVRQPFRELGLDSLMAVELRNAIGAALGRVQPATLLFDHPTLDALSQRMLADLDAAEQRSVDPGGDDRPRPADALRPAPVEPPVDLDAAELAALSDDEVEALLLRELEHGGGQP